MARRKPPKHELVPLASWPALPPWHGLLSPLVANTFAELKVSISLWISGDFWHVMHHAPNLGVIESNLGVAERRWGYDKAQFELVKRTRKYVRGEHLGFYDGYMPVQHAGRLMGVLVAGPYAKSYPTSAQVQQRWQTMSGTAGHLTEPLFSEYVAMTLSTLTLEGAREAQFEQLMARFAVLVSDRGDANALASEASELGRALLQARVVERTWDAAHRLVDEKSAMAWPIYGRTILKNLGLHESVAHVVVALLGGGLDEAEPLDRLLRAAAFQRECVGLGLKLGGVVSGRVGERGVSFVLDASGERKHFRAKVSELLAAATSNAKALGFTLHAGVGRVPDGVSVPLAYRTARFAAEKALAEGARVIHGQSEPEHSQERMRQIRDGLERSIQQRPDLLMPRFDRYVETVLAHVGYRLEAVRTELEIAVERLVAPLLAASLMEQKTLSELRIAQDHATGAAQTVAELVTAYRVIVAGIEGALRNPIAARRDRSTERAMRYVREHLSEPLTVKHGARAAGLAPSHFAGVFRLSEGMPFALYVRKERVQRARDMLRTTALSVEQIQKLCGFQSRASFYRVFKRALGVTPGEYRQRS